VEVEGLIGWLVKLQWEDVHVATIFEMMYYLLVL
jgi:hypothetical protein